MHLCGDRETTGSTPLGMVIPSIEEEEEVEVEDDENGSMRDLQKDQMEEWEDDSPVEMEERLGEISQVHTMRNQQDRQEEEWSVPTSIERREDDTVRQESQRAPPTPPLSEDRLFTHWSSLDSPRARTSPQNASVRETEQGINQPEDQTNQPGSEPAQIEVMGNALHGNVTSLSTCRQLDQVGTRLIDMGTNTSDIGVRPRRDGVRIIDSDDDDVQVSCPHVDVILPGGMNEQTPMPHINLSISRYDPESSRGSHTRTHDTRMQETIPQ